MVPSCMAVTEHVGEKQAQWLSLSEQIQKTMDLSSPNIEVSCRCCLQPSLGLIDHENCYILGGIPHF